MSLKDRFFPPERRIKARLNVRLERREDIQEQIFYEEDTTSVDGRPLFVGFSFRPGRFQWAMAVMFLAMGLLLGRSAWMQVKEGNAYRAQAEANRQRELPLWPRRGVIYDRNGVVLAENAPRFQVTAIPRDIEQDPAARSAELGIVARSLGLSIHDLEPIVSVTGTRLDEPVIVQDRVPYERALALAVHLPNLPGFLLEVRPLRRYPLSGELASLAHLLGYVGKISEDEWKTRRSLGYRRLDEIGKAGVERSHESLLRGTVGSRTYEVDARGRLQVSLGEAEPVDGMSLTLTLDTRLQRVAERSLTHMLEQEKLGRGAVVALNPQDGSVLALVSLPGYDNNLFSGGVSSTVYQALSQDKNQPLFPRAYSGVYPSGSTVKIVVSVAALMENIVTPATTVVSTGGLRLGQWFFPDWKAGGHGTVNVRSAIAWSVNTFFYTVGGGYNDFQGMGPDKLTHWMKVFGLGKKTGLDVPAEAAGFVPTREWKENDRKQPWYVGDTYNVSIGQGDLLVTPVQVAAYTAAIANGGKQITPHLFQEAQIPPVNRIAPEDTVNIVREGMRDCVTLGSCRGLSTLPFAAGAKTGTAQWNKDRNTHAWFTSFAPYEQPEIVVTVLLEEGGEGSRVAVPVARDILAAWHELRGN